jgi:hypothetical protein
VKSKLRNPKRYIGSNSNNRKEEEVLQLVDEVVLGVVAEVRLNSWKMTCGLSCMLLSKINQVRMQS